MRADQVLLITCPRALVGGGGKLLRHTIKQVVQLVCALPLATPNLIWFLIRLCSGSVSLCFLFRT